MLYRIFIRIFLLILLLSPSTLLATTILQATIDELANRSELVFQGRVTHIEARLETKEMVSTYITFTVLEVIIGVYDTKELTLKFLGGNIPGVKDLQVSGMNLPKEGEEGVYFVESLKKNLVNPLYGWEQGHFILKMDEDGTKRVSTYKGKPVISLMTGDVKTPIKGKLSTGNAAGVVAGAEVGIDKAMELDSFKAEIKALKK